MEINGATTRLTDPCGRSSKPQPGTEELPIEWVARIFAKFQVRYGHKWVSAYPAGTVLDLALVEWAQGLGGFSADEIKHGLDAWSGDWPPSLPEFKRACRPPAPPACRRLWRALAAPKVDKSLARRALDELKLMTGLLKFKDWIQTEVGKSGRAA